MPQNATSDQGPLFATHPAVLDTSTSSKIGFVQILRPGPICSKLTMSLVNVTLNLLSLNMAYTLIFLLEKWE